MRSHNGGFTRALMEVLVVDDHTGSDAWVVHSVAAGVRGTSSSFSLFEISAKTRVDTYINGFKKPRMP